MERRNLDVTSVKARAYNLQRFHRRFSNALFPGDEGGVILVETTPIRTEMFRRRV